MKLNKTMKGIMVVALLTLMPLTACGKGNDRDARRQGPPPEAIKACEGKASGDSVTFTGRKGESLEATCKKIEGQLAAVPEGMGQDGRPQ